MIPYKIESVFTRIPSANIVIVVFTTIFSFAIWWEYIPQSAADAMVLRGWDVGQMFTSTLVHGNFMHLFGNMLFLWIFGNAVCAAVGSITYPFLYVFLAIVSSVADLAFDGRPSIGASGAIGGIIGTAFILFPLNKVRTFFSFLLPFTFSIKCFWMIAIWFMFDNIVPVIQGGGHVAYWAHIGGFAGGMAAGYALIVFNAVETYDPTFIDILSGKKLEREIHNVYTLKELTDAQDHGKEAEGLVVAETRTGPADPRLQDFQFKEHTAPVFRLLNSMMRGTELICYFVNDGDPVYRIVVESSTPPAVKLHPTETLAKRGSGWLQADHAGTIGPREISMVLSYDIGTGFRVTKTFVFEENGNRFSFV